MMEPDAAPAPVRNAPHALRAVRPGCEELADGRSRKASAESAAPGRNKRRDGAPSGERAFAKARRRRKA